MIVIEKPEVVVIGSKARLHSNIVIDGLTKNIWFEVDLKYKEYLCYERSDAFVVALLNYAMREGHDINCKSPMGEDLYYQINTYLIDAVYQGSKVLYKTTITADIDSSQLPTGNAVGTGISAGIDSFHSIAENSHSRFKNHNITHLTFNNVGSHGEGERAERLYAQRLQLARNFASEYKYELVESNSNIHDQIEQEHYLTHTYTSCFAVFCLQKLYSTYFYSSSFSFLEFSLKDNERYGSDFYELLILSAFSTNNMKILSEGATVTRLAKTLTVSSYEPSYKYLNVCTESFENCSKCEKCTRTLLALDALNKLDYYESVFDIKYYRNNKQHYFETLVYKNFIKSVNYVELYPLLQNQINLTTKLKVYPKLVRPFITSLVPNKIKMFLREYKKVK